MKPYGTSDSVNVIHVKIKDGSAGRSGSDAQGSVNSPGYPDTMLAKQRSEHGLRFTGLLPPGGYQGSDADQVVEIRVEAKRVTE